MVENEKMVELDTRGCSSKFFDEKLANCFLLNLAQILSKVAKEDFCEF